MIEDQLAELAYLHRLEKRVQELLPNNAKHEPKRQYSNPYSSVPPNDVLSNAVLALDIAGYYRAFSQVLADYYGMEAPPYYVNTDKVPDGAIACYYPPPVNTIYDRGSGMTKKTAFHEFYHALQSQHVVPNPLDKKESEENAVAYAKCCMKILDRLGLS